MNISSVVPSSDAATDTMSDFEEVYAGDARLIPASSVFQVGHTRDRSESVFSILETSVFEFHFLNSCCSETAVDFVEICNVYFGKMIIKSTKRIFNSDKIYRSYSDLNFGVTFLEHSVVRLLLTNILNPQKCLPDKFQNNRRLIRRLTTAVQCLQGFCSSMSSRQSVIFLPELLFVTKHECILRTRSGSTTLHQYKEIRGTIVTAGKHFLTQSETFSC